MDYDWGVDRNSKLAKELERATGVSARRLARWPKDLLPPSPRGADGQVSAEAVAHLKELDRLIGRGKANADLGNDLEYNDHVALIMAARGHATERLRGVATQMVAGMINNFASSSGLDVGLPDNDPDSVFVRLEDLASAVAANMHVVSPTLRDLVDRMVNNASVSLEQSPADVFHTMLTSTASAAFGDGLYDVDIAPAAVRIDPSSPEAQGLTRLIEEGNALRFELTKLLGLLDTVPLERLVSAAVEERLWTRFGVARLLAARPGMDDQIDEIAAVTGILGLGVDPKTIRSYARAHEQLLKRLDPEVVARLPGLMPRHWQEAIDGNA